MATACGGCSLSYVDTADDEGHPGAEFPAPAKGEITTETRQVREPIGLYSNEWTEVKLETGGWVKHGRFTTSFKSTRVVEEYAYDRGVLQGRYRHFDLDNGAITAEGNLVNGLRHGVCRRFWPNGNLESEGEYVSGLGVGLHREWYRNGKLHTEGVLAIDRLGQSMEVGRWRYWYDNGQLQRDGMWDADGAGKRGLWKRWHRNGQLAWQGRYEADPNSLPGWLEAGVWLFWHDNGSLAAMGQYERGFPVDKWWLWAPDGRPVDVIEFAVRFSKGSLVDVAHDLAKRAGMPR